MHYWLCRQPFPQKMVTVQSESPPSPGPAHAEFSALEHEPTAYPTRFHGDGRVRAWRPTAPPPSRRDLPFTSSSCCGPGQFSAGGECPVATTEMNTLAPAFRFPQARRGGADPLSTVPRAPWPPLPRRSSMRQDSGHLTIQ